MAYKEDPLERLDREERERKERNTDLRKVMYALIAVAALLAGALAYIWIQKSSLVKELEVEKEDLTDFQELQRIRWSERFPICLSPQEGQRF